ncbi:hypothetical protein ACFO25_07060 [Paenactinomyces guangxiensis]|uniref:Uncharacterized protein n=1 Tax=Paenactinomyces guangxiensis TaxID=1490290 RepID=A0A7W1WNK0_9BACL|nr:hypothetical protein [Paenactinomyces guangxiensis]MBA4493193.1 hypothetical protein [Paenactinomyces guangxiensis]MBH8589957.1 hypothetical protein [Paenactinomyces guangxiensis]
MSQKSKCPVVSLTASREASYQKTDQKSSHVIPFKRKGDSKTEPLISTWTLEPKKGSLPLKITQVSSGFGKVHQSGTGPKCSLAA